MRRTSICGAVETLLIEEKALNSHAKEIVNSLIDSGCEVRVDSKINKLFQNKLMRQQLPIVLLKILQYILTVSFYLLCQLEIHQQMA